MKITFLTAGVPMVLTKIRRDFDFFYFERFDCFYFVFEFEFVWLCFERLENGRSFHELCFFCFERFVYP